MFNTRKLRKEIARLQQIIDQNNDAYAKLIKKAKKDGKDSEEILNIYVEGQAQCQFEETRIEELKTQILRIEADKYDIELPDYEDKQYWEKEYNQHHLTRLGRQHVRQLIRIERQEKRKPFIEYASLLIGILGVLTALISVLK